MPPLPWRTKTDAQPDESYLVMASRLPLRSRRTVPRFMQLTLSVVRQLERTEGLIGYTLLAQPMKGTFWTLSAWTGQPALDAFARPMRGRSLRMMARWGMALAKASRCCWSVQADKVQKVPFIGWASRV